VHAGGRRQLNENWKYFPKNPFASPAANAPVKFIGQRNIGIITDTHVLLDM
jgi:hypothetical protein